MRYLLTLIFLVPLLAHTQQRSYVINSGQSIGDVLRHADMYQYPGFRSGIVIFGDGYRKPALLNYSYIGAALLFISPKGDTLALTGLEQLESAVIGEDTFFFHGTPLFQLASVPGRARLLERQYLQNEGRTKLGGYGISDPGGATESVTRVETPNMMQTLTLSERTTIVRQSELFIWLAGAGAPVAVSKGTLEKLFPDKKQVLKEYLSRERVDFHNPAQVKALFGTLAGNLVSRTL